MIRWILPLFLITALNARSDRTLVLPSFDHGGGLFHNFMNVIGFLDYCEREKIINYAVDFAEDGHYYEPDMGSNWWNYYFEPIEHKSFLIKLISNVKNTNKRVNSDRMAEFVRHVECVMSRERAHQLIARYIRPKPDIQKAVDDFAWKHFNDRTIIGVHYRGTDKMQKMVGFANPESPHVAFQAVYDKIDDLLTQWTGKRCKVFVATDSEAFLQAIKKRYPSLVVCTPSMRSSDGTPLHYNVKQKKAHYNYLQGRETVIDCLLLARCHHLIKTSSNLNLCASFFNPKLEITSLSNRLESQ